METKPWMKPVRVATTVHRALAAVAVVVRAAAGRRMRRPSAAHAFAQHASSCTTKTCLEFAGNSTAPGAQVAGLPTPKAAGSFVAPPDLDHNLYDPNTGFGLFALAFGTRYGTHGPLPKIENVRPLCMDFFKQGFCNQRRPPARVASSATTKSKARARLSMSRARPSTNRFRWACTRRNRAVGWASSASTRRAIEKAARSTLSSVRTVW